MQVVGIKQVMSILLLIVLKNFNTQLAVTLLLNTGYVEFSLIALYFNLEKNRMD